MRLGGCDAREAVRSQGEVRFPSVLGIEFFSCLIIEIIKKKKIIFNFLFPMIDCYQGTIERLIE